MTDREKAIVMAYTGITMLTGDKCQIFDKYVEDILGRPIFTHEMASLADEIKKKSKADFIALCEEESEEENIRGFCVEIAGNLTNGDVIKAMFPSMNIQERNNITLDIRGKTVEFTGMALREWWNAPYKAESEDKE